MSNLPPGVSANDPHITGEYPVDPHAPFDAVRDVEKEGKWMVLFGGHEEDYYWNNLSESAAKGLASLLNNHWSLRDEQRNKIGQCRVCGDFHGEIEDV